MSRKEYQLNKKFIHFALIQLRTVYLISSNVTEVALLVLLVRLTSKLLERDVRYGKNPMTLVTMADTMSMSRIELQIQHASLTQA